MILALTKFIQFFSTITFESLIYVKISRVLKLTFASEKDALAAAVLPLYCKVGVPLSSSTLKHDDLNPDTRENPDGQSIGA